jgi:RNA polymerase sigma-70 factor (ECF subfamily)
VKAVSVATTIRIAATSAKFASFLLLSRQTGYVVNTFARRTVERELLNGSDADDATQNAMIAIARSYESFDGRSAFSTWVYRIATNAALDERRRRNRRPVSLFSNDGQQVDIADTRSDDEQSAFEASDYLAQGLAQIPEEFRVALVLRDVADLDYEEISQVLGIPIGTVRSRIARGRGRLADILGNLEVPDERLNPDTGHQS